MPNRYLSSKGDFRTRIRFQCGLCGDSFFRAPSAIKHGGGKFCTAKCQTLKRKSVPLAERFWPKVDKSRGLGPNGDCWEWAAATVKGYGMLGRRGAHQVSWEIHNASIPEGLCVLHRCDNPPCVNPDHLFLGTKKDNAQDAIHKGRWTQSKGNHRTLTANVVKEIRNRYRPRSVTFQSLGDEFGVTASAISHIIHRRTWGDVP